MTDDRPAEAAALLLEAARSFRPIDRLPPHCRPNSAAEAYAIQDLVAAATGPIGGWKTGVAAPGAVPSCAPIFARDIRESGAVLDAALLHQPALEIEFAFRIERDLEPAGRPWDRAAIVEAISFVPLIEVLGSRYRSRADCAEWEALADRNANGAAILGAAVADWQRLDWRRLRVDLAIDGRLVQSAQGTHPLGDPVELVVWQANHCIRRGMPLQSGMVVTTGSLQGASPIAAGSHAAGRWGVWGQIELRFR
jgi:2-keto-4-pentenoate hydratase